MKAEQIDKALYEKFIGQGERLVFWNDESEEFADYVKRGLSGELGDIKVINLSEAGGLSTRLLLEEEDTDNRYLLYRPGEAPLPEEDWLLDIRLYSAEFHADIASVWLQELGLDGLYLRDHLKARETFLGNQDRRRKLKKLIAADDDEAAIDRKMMAVLAGSQLDNLFAIVRAICDAHMQDGSFDLSEVPKAVTAMDKMSLAKPFWQLVAKEFRYENDSPSMAGLLRCLFVSDLFHQLSDATIDALAHFQLPPAGRHNAVVCLTQWRDSSRKAPSYDAAAAALAEDLKVKDHLGAISAESLAEVYTFWDVEKRLVAGLKERVLAEGAATDVDEIAALASDRKAGHWLAGPSRDLPDRLAVKDAYDSIFAAARLFALLSTYEGGFRVKTPDDVLFVYQSELYRIDQLYRHIMAKGRAARSLGWDLLKGLMASVEAAYDQKFLEPLGLVWSKMLDEGFLNEWRSDSLLPQQDFYNYKIEPYLAQSERRRAYVIISDGLRFEAAQEFVETLNGRERMSAEIEPMLGVLPSYTALGMASLLPHGDLSYSDSGEVLVDGRHSSGVANRDKQLSRFDGMACQAKDLIAMKTEEAREFTRGKRLVYIYHDVIDKCGENSEEKTFEAVEQCLQELVQLVQFCKNKLNAADVWVTADHGFLYQEDTLDGTDKSTLTKEPNQPFKKNKRFILGRDLSTAPEAHHCTTSVTAGMAHGVDVWIPRGTNRFHFTAGARYYHGGAMPQEVVVPLVKVKQLRGESAAQSKIEKVHVTVLGGNHRITTPSHRFELIQTDAVGERRLPLTARIAVYEGSQAVTSIETLVFDSSSDNIGERQKSVKLKLQTGEFDKSKPYRLVLRDAETDTEVLAVPVVIDRSFDDDF